MKKSFNFFFTLFFFIFIDSSTFEIINTAKYLADYRTTGFNLIKDGGALEFSGDSAELCAKHCSTQTDNCNSFNFCPAIDNQRSYCELSSKTTESPGVRFYTKQLCRHYERHISAVNNKTNNNDVFHNSNTKVSGMSSKSFFGLIFGLFILGAVLGAIGFIGFQYYRKEMTNGEGGIGLSVIFNRKNEERATVH